jgi:hypothetical protein
MASRASYLAHCCVASPHTAAYHLPASLPLIASILLTCNHLSMHQLLVAMPLVAPPLQLVLLAHCCLSMRHLRLPPICLLFALASCHVTSRNTTPLIVSMRCRLSTRRLVVALPLVAPPSQLILLTGGILAGCSAASHCTTSAARPLSASLSLNKLPPPLTFRLPFVCLGWLSLSRPFSSHRLCLLPSQCTACYILEEIEWTGAVEVGRPLVRGWPG